MLLKIKNQALALTIYVALATYGLIAAMMLYLFLTDRGARGPPIFFDQELNVSLCAPECIKRDERTVYISQASLDNWDDLFD